ncbi:hypothetical protein LEM8419_02045 [Neolewinella maritima]|uniref:Uncharacterized protein n=1 Tax=Neolewinella maritima TaxID=1383882 RepID=A0ABN8F2E8_9BACT|nr:hypothetical protein [Neolewinella maritima]CAH1001108.1 hypothetical protein LEM8419_02045 [Neolewinella maritima]
MRTLLLLALILLCTGVRAQVLTVSDELTMRNDTEYSLIGKLGGQVLLLQDRENKHLLTAYGRTMNQSWEKDLELRGRNVRVLDAVADQDGTGFHLLYLYRERGRNHLQLDRYNPAGNLQDSVTLVDFGMFATAPEDEVYRSDDESKLLLLMVEQQSKARYLGIDLDSMQLLYDNELAPEKFFFGEDFLQAEISNYGDMYFVVDRDNFKSKRKEHRYEVYTHVADGAKTDMIDVRLGDSLTYDVFFRYDNLNKHLTAGGLYSTKDFSRADGYFFVAIDPRATTQRPHFQRFPTSLVKNVEGKKYNKRNPGITDLTVREAMLRRDGGMVMITERDRQLQRRGGAIQNQLLNTYSGRALIDYHFDEIVAIAVNPDGSPHWSNIMHKKQYSQDDGGVYSGFFVMESPSRLRFLFNDEIRFENTVSEYVLNGRGEFDRNSLFSTRDLELRLRFRDGIQVASNELVLPSEHRNRLRLVKMTYEAR